MSYEKVEQAKKTIIGTKQAVKAIRAGIVTEVIIALDAEERIIDSSNGGQPRNHNVQVTYVDSKDRTWKCMWHSSRCSRGCDYCVIVFVYKAQRLCFYPKNEPPGCVVLQKKK